MHGGTSIRSAKYGALRPADQLDVLEMALDQVCMALPVIMAHTCCL